MACGGESVGQVPFEDRGEPYGVPRVGLGGFDVVSAGVGAFFEASDPGFGDAGELSEAFLGQAGCDPVLPRSKFVEELPRALPEWLAPAPPAANRP